MRLASRFLVALTVGVLAAAVAAPATASSGSALTRSIGVAHIAHPRATFGMTQSNNWSGYNQGFLEKGTQFHAISGEWVVPTATAHKSGEAEFSASWIGIGGGCVDAGCTLTDPTLIQAGTEQDIDSSGKATYTTWYELIPAPSISTPLAVSPGNVVKVNIAQTLPEVWAITISNVSTGKSWSTTVPYTSTYATAEWIEETPVVVGGGGSASVGPLPNLGSVHFDNATTNGAAANLASGERMQLVDFNGNVLATPSTPDADTDGFNDCTYATTCTAPTSEL